MIPVNDLKRGYMLFKDEYDKKAIDVLNSGWYVLGEEVKKFEEEFASILKIEHCIGVDNGLNAIALGIKALGIQEGDEVIVQANTYIATCLAVTYNNAKIVFVEPDEYFNIDAKKIEHAITKRTKAVLVTHLYGQCSNMDDIKRICDKHQLFLLEDCAQSHLSSYKGQQSGTFGEMGFFSFYPTKNLGGFGDGGAVVTHSEEYANKIRVLRNYGSDKKYYNVEIGYNSRLDELQAGLLRVKLKHLKTLTLERQEIAMAYNERIHNPLIEKPKTLNGVEHVYHLYVVRVKNREQFRDYMSKNQIGTDIHYPIPVHLSKAYEFYHHALGSFPLAETYSNEVVSIPMFNGMIKQEVEQVIKIVNAYKG